MEKRICSSCKLEKSIEEFSIKSAPQRSTKCKPCTKLYSKQHYIKNKQKYLERNLNYKNGARKNIIEVIAKIKSAPCSDCGVSYHPYVMDFDHINPETKFLTISKMVSLGYRWPAIKKEMDKCELVCANCHRYRTYTRYNADHSSG